MQTRVLNPIPIILNQSIISSNGNILICIMCTRILIWHTKGSKKPGRPLIFKTVRCARYSFKTNRFKKSHSFVHEDDSFHANFHLLSTSSFCLYKLTFVAKSNRIFNRFRTLLTCSISVSSHHFLRRKIGNNKTNRKNDTGCRKIRDTHCKMYRERGKVLLQPRTFLRVLESLKRSQL